MGSGLLTLTGKYRQIELLPEPSSMQSRFPGMLNLAPGPGNEWTEEEHAHISRLKRLCGQVPYWELDCKQTEAGDPWCIIYDHDHHRVVLHIARIDRRYLVVWPLQQRSETRATMAAAIDLILAEMAPT
jgi:hypothetical protein